MSLHIIGDTREKFEPEWSPDVDSFERATLAYADYSARGVTDIVALELKWSLDDLVGCVTHDRPRFDAMLQGLERYPVKALIIAATQDDVKQHRYTSKVSPASIMGSLWAWSKDYSLPYHFARDAAGATWLIEWMLRRVVEKNERGYYDLRRADRRDLMSAVREGVRLEMWHELLCSRAAPPPDHLSEMDRRALAAQLRETADYLDPQPHPAEEPQ